MITDELTKNYLKPVAEDMDFQRRAWFVERIGWVCMAVVMAAALLGLFATGPLSRAQIQTQDLQVTYERFGRYSLPTRYDIVTHAGASVRLSGTFHDYYNVKITPAPSREIHHGDNTGYFFETASDEPLKIRIEATPVRAGIFTGKIGAGTDAPVEVRQFIYR